MSLSPIILFVYKRLWHTRQTIQSLQKNKLAEESDLFIFSDGPKYPSEKNKVDEIRNYINSITGFREIIVQQSDVNLGLANSVINGISKVIREHKKIIVLEDDLIISPRFLEFMNEALNFYEDNQKIFSISGYSFPIEIPESYKDDVYILPRSTSWGWATWLNRWQKADWEVKDFNEFRHNKNYQKGFNKGGNDLSAILKLQTYGYLDSWGIRWAYTHYKNEGYCLYPVQSRIKNIGADGSGTHFRRKTKKYDVEIKNDLTSLKLNDNIACNPEILTQVKNIVNLSFIRKIINIFKLNPVIGDMHLKLLKRHQ